MKIGIRQEELDKRAPIAPIHVPMLNKNDIQIYVQPSTRRAFSDLEYQKAGAHITNDLSEMDIIFGVKEIPCDKILRNKAYCFFSHTIKAQEYNMPMLQCFIDSNNTMIDYEKIVDDKGNRLIAFGKFAGYAGMIDSLWIYGQRLLDKGIKNPFAFIKQACKYNNLAEAKDAVLEARKTIATQGFNKDFPFICGFTGTGRVSQGAQEIYSLLPCREINVQNLKNISANFSKNHVYKVAFSLADLFSHRENKSFSRKEYQNTPQHYTSNLHKYISELSILVNGIYWEPRYPCLFRTEDLKLLFSEHENPPLELVTDITCDVNGSIEFNVKSTSSDDPCYTYDYSTQTIKDGWRGKGLCILAVDKLPGELPRESSEFFSSQLYPLLLKITKSKSREFDPSTLPPMFCNAVIAHKGKLTSNYQYLQKYIKEK